MSLEIAVWLKLKNQMAAALPAAVKDVLKQTEQLHRQSADAGIRHTTKFNRAYEVLGVRSNRAIAREIQLTEAAYERLRRSGTLSMHEQGRAADAAKRKVQELRNEMGQLTKMQSASMVGRGAMGIAAGAAAAKYVLQPKAEAAMSYDLRLAHMSNTAFAKRDLPGRKAGISELDASIKQALRFGGGTRDSAASALDEMIASGVVNVGSAQRMLKNVMLAATSSGADATNFSNIAVRGMTNMHIPEGDVGKLFSIATSAGQQGGFEIKDMAKWLPAQMALAGNLGMRGTEGFAKLAALNQAAVTTAGTKDEAGNNVVNLLAKINSPDTAKDAQKLGINLPYYLAHQRGKGVDAIDAFTGLIGKEVGKDPAFKDLSRRINATKDDAEKKSMYEDMLRLVEGKGAGKLIQDRQALMALIPLLSNGQYVKDVTQKSLGDTGAVDRNAQLIKDTSSFKTAQAGNEKQFAEQSMFEKLMPAINSVADGLTKQAREYPNFTMATVAATTALGALAAAAGAAGLAGLLTGGGVPGAAKSTIGAAGRLMGRAGMVGAAGAAGYGAGTMIYDHMLSGNAVGDAVGAGIARVLSFFGNKEAQEAVRINSSLNKTQEVPKASLEGTLKIIVDDEGRVKAVKQVAPLGPRVNIDVGYVMGGAG
jgi:TP901 family phage tail tape measure protein